MTLVQDKGVARKRGMFADRVRVERMFTGAGAQCGHLILRKNVGNKHTTLAKTFSVNFEDGLLGKRGRVGGIAGTTQLDKRPLLGTRVGFRRALFIN